MAAFDIGNDRVGIDRHARGAERLSIRALSHRAEVNHGGQLLPSLNHGQRIDVGGIVVGVEQACLTQADAITRHIGPRGMGQHGARTVIVVEQHGSLKRALGQDNLLSADAM